MLDLTSRTLVNLKTSGCWWNVQQFAGYCRVGDLDNAIVLTVELCGGSLNYLIIKKIKCYCYITELKYTRNHKLPNV